MAIEYRPQRSRPVNLGLWVLLLVVATPFAGCKRKGEAPAGTSPELALRPEAEARKDLVAEVAFAAPQKTLTTMGALAPKLGLPFTAESMGQALLAKTGLPAQALERVDLSKPLTVAFVPAAKLPADKQGDGDDKTAAIVSLALKDGSRAGFDAFAAGLGQVADKDRDAVRVRGADAGPLAEFWMLPRQGAVCIAKTKDLLVSGCALALAARREVPADLNAAMFPEAMARAHGTTVQAAIGQAKEKFADIQGQTEALDKTGGGAASQSAAANKLTETTVGPLLELGAQTEQVRLGISLDGEKGLDTNVVIQPRAGSDLSKMIAPRRSYAVDPAILGGPPPAMLAAMGDISYSRYFFDSVRQPFMDQFVPADERAEVDASIDRIFDALSGPQSLRFDFLDGPKLAFAYEIVYTMKEGTEGESLLGDMERLLKAKWIGNLFETLSGGMARMKLAAKREGDTLVTSLAFDTKRLPAKTRAELKDLPFFGTPFEVRMAAANERLVVAMGPSAKSSLAALAKQTARGEPSAEIRAALDETKGRDGFYFMDLAAILRPGIAAGMSARQGSAAGPAAGAMGMIVGLLQNARLVMWGSHQGGDDLAVNWHVPMSTFNTIGALLTTARGGGGGP